MTVQHEQKSGSWLDRHSRTNLCLVGFEEKHLVLQVVCVWGCVCVVGAQGTRARASYLEHLH